MKIFLPLLFTFAGICAAATPAAPASKDPVKLPNGEHLWPEMDEADARSVMAALPEKAPAVPEKPRKLLIFYRSDGFQHPSIPSWNKLIVEMGRKTGAYTATLSQSYDDLTPEKLADYDGVFFNNTCRLHMPESAKTALQDFVKGGKGFAGNHGSGDNWHDWPEGKEMLGSEIVAHPFGRIQVKVDDPKSPITAAFSSRSFAFVDEIYAFKDPYTRAKLHLLLSIDYPNSPDVAKDEEKLREQAAAPDAKPHNQESLTAIRADKDYAISWIRPWGQGRLFYCSLGHRKNVAFDPAMAKFYLAGIQYALGDLKADDQPSGSVAAPPAK